MENQVRIREAAKVVVRTRTTCRMCGSKRLVKVWSFGETPLANAYLKPEDIGRGGEEPFASLDIYYCRDCCLAQMLDVVDPNVLFENYLYVSSTSPSFVKHFEDYAGHLIDRFKLNAESLVVDIGSNDGILLKPLKAAGVKVLGIDPAENLAAMANEAGIETIADFFTPELARRLAAERGRADVISANNVFAHTDGVDIFVEAVKRLLSPRGVFVFEVQYLGDLIEKKLFDIIYHEHLCYYSVHPLVEFFAGCGMEVFDVERLPVHGGSLRVYVQFEGGPYDRPSERITEILHEEKVQALTTLAPYQQFAARVASNKEKLQRILREIKAEGKKIVGYGAPAKATTLCYALGIDGDVLDYIVDDDKKIKQGLLMPGTHIPIVSPDYLYKPFDTAQGKPDYCLILAWNFAEQIRKNHRRFEEQGGRFIIPVPEPKIV